MLLLLLPVMVHLVLLFGSNIRHPAVAGRERGTRDVMAASFSVTMGQNIGSYSGTPASRRRGIAAMASQVLLE